MNPQQYAKQLIDVLRRIEAGETGITCPKCGRGTVHHSYTHFGDDRYGTWLECDFCDMVEAAHGPKRPRGFRDELINPKFQRLDEEAWANVQSKFKNSDHADRGSHA